MFVVTSAASFLVNVCVRGAGKVAEMSLINVKLVMRSGASAGFILPGLNDDNLGASDSEGD